MTIFKFSITIKALTGSGLFYRFFYHEVKKPVQHKNKNDFID